MSIEDEMFSSALLSELTQAQELILQHREFVRTRFGHASQRLFISGRARVQIEDRLDEIDALVDEFYDSEMNRSYREGYRDGASKVEDIMGKKNVPRSAPIRSTDRSWLSRMRKQGKEEMHSAIAQTKAKASAEFSGLTPETVNSRLATKKGFRTVPLGSRNFSIDNYADIMLNSRTQTAKHRGQLAAYRDNGITHVYCSDSPGCGWKGHDDGEAADGKIVDLDTATANPRSHPHCRRSFLPYGKGKKPKGFADYMKKAGPLAFFRGPFGPAAAGAGALALGAAGAYAFTNRIFILQQINKFLISGEPLWRQFDFRIKALLDTLERDIKLGGKGVTDVASGKEVPHSYENLLENLHAEMIRYVEVPGGELSQNARYILGVTKEDTPLDVIGKIQEFDRFHDTYNKNKMTNQIWNSIDNLESKARSDLVSNLGWSYEHDYGIGSNTQVYKDLVELGKKKRKKLYNLPANNIIDKLEEAFPNNNVVRMTLPNIEAQGNRGWHRGFRTRLNLGEWVRFTGTTKLNGERVGSIHFNRNGLARLGFQMREVAPGKFRWYPRFSLVPRKLPVRVITRINRGVAGDINSISGTFRILMPGPFNVSSNFNVNLRHLHLHDLHDLTNISLKDIAGFKWDDFRIRSLALESRLKLMNRVDLARVYRMKWEDIIRLTKLSLDDVEGSGEVTRRFSQLAKRAERRYFEPVRVGGRKNLQALLDDATDGFPVMRKLVGGPLKEYYDKKTDVILEFVDEMLTHKHEILIDPLEQRFQKVVDVIHGFHLDNNEMFSPAAANKWLKILRAKASGKIDNAYAVFDSELSMLNEDAQRIWARTLDTMHAVHKKLFVDMPADRRRRILRLVEEEIDIEDGIKWYDGDIKTHLKVYGQSIIETANEHNMSIEGARKLQNISRRKLRKVIQSVQKALRDTSSRDRLILNMTSTNGWKDLGGVTSRNWAELVANHDDDLVNMIGRWFDEAENLRLTSEKLRVLQDSRSYFYKHGIDLNELDKLVAALQRGDRRPWVRDAFDKLTRSRGWNKLWSDRDMKPLKWEDFIDEAGGKLEDFFGPGSLESKLEASRARKIVDEGLDARLLMREQAGLDYLSNMDPAIRRIIEKRFDDLYPPEIEGLLSDAADEMQHLMELGVKFPTPDGAWIEGAASRRVVEEYLRSFVVGSDLQEFRKSLGIMRTLADEYPELMRDLRIQDVVTRADQLAYYSTSEHTLNGSFRSVLGLPDANETRRIISKLLDGFFSDVRTKDVGQKVISHELGHTITTHRDRSFINSQDGLDWFYRLFSDLSDSNITDHKTLLEDEKLGKLFQSWSDDLDRGREVWGKYQKGEIDILSADDEYVMELYKKFRQLNVEMDGWSKDDRRAIAFLMEELEPQLATSVSRYGATNPWEVMAELFSEGLISDAPSKYAVDLLMETRKFASRGTKLAPEIAGDLAAESRAVGSLHRELDLADDLIDRGIRPMKWEDFLDMADDQEFQDTFGVDDIVEALDESRDHKATDAARRAAAQLRDEIGMDYQKYVSDDILEILQRTEAIEDYWGTRYTTEAEFQLLRRDVVEELKWLNEFGVEFPMSHGVAISNNPFVEEIDFYDWVDLNVEGKDLLDFRKSLAVLRMAAEKMPTAMDGISFLQVDDDSLFLNALAWYENSSHSIRGNFSGIFGMSNHGEMDKIISGVLQGFFSDKRNVDLTQTLFSHELGHAMSMRILDDGSSFVDSTIGRDWVFETLDKITGTKVRSIGDITSDPSLAQHYKVWRLDVETGRQIRNDINLGKIAESGLSDGDRWALNLWDNLSSMKLELENWSNEDAEIFSFLADGFCGDMRSAVSDYGSYNVWEFMAEMFSEGLMSDYPSPYAVDLLRQLIKFYGG